MPQRWGIAPARRGVLLFLEPCFTICSSDFSIVACSIAGSSSAFSSSTIQSTVGLPVPRFIQASSLGVVWPSTMKVASGKCPMGLHPQETASCWPNSKWASVSDQTSSPMFEAKRTCKMDKPMVSESDACQLEWSYGSAFYRNSASFATKKSIVKKMYG